MLRGFRRRTVFISALSFDGITLSEEDREHEGKYEEECSEVNGSFLKNVRGAGTPGGISHTGAKCRAEAFLLGTLHQNDENEQKGNHYVSDYHQVDCNREPAENHGKRDFMDGSRLVKPDFSLISSPNSGFKGNNSP